LAAFAFGKDELRRLSDLGSDDVGADCPHQAVPGSLGGFIIGEHARQPHLHQIEKGGQVEVAIVMEQIGKLRERIEAMEANRERICEIRLDELTRPPELEWDGGLGRRR